MALEACVTHSTKPKWVTQKLICCFTSSFVAIRHPSQATCSSNLEQQIGLTTNNLLVAKNRWRMATDKKVKQHLNFSLPYLVSSSRPTACHTRERHWRWPAVRRRGIWNESIDVFILTAKVLVDSTSLTSAPRFWESGSPIGKLDTFVVMTFLPEATDSFGLSSKIWWNIQH